MSESVVLSEVDGRGVGTVTLNRPAVNNAYDAAVIEGLARAFAALAANPTVSVVVMRGNGKHCQSGADLTFLKKLAGRSLAHRHAFCCITLRTVATHTRRRLP